MRARWTCVHTRCPHRSRGQLYMCEWGVPVLVPFLRRPRDTAVTRQARVWTADNCAKLQAGEFSVKQAVGATLIRPEGHQPWKPGDCTYPWSSLSKWSLSRNRPVFLRLLSL